MTTIIEVAVGVALSPLVFMLGLVMLRALVDAVHAFQDSPELCANTGILACVGALAAVMWWVG